MKKYLTIILVLCGITGGMPHEGYADGECTPNKLLKESFNEAVAAEKSGNLPLAFSAFQFAEGQFGCEGPNPSWQEAQAGWKRIGQRIGKEAEAKAIFHAYGKNEGVTTPSGLQLNQWIGAGAFQWYSLIGESAGADRVMFRFAQSKPKDYSTMEIALKHFGAATGGKGNMGRPEDNQWVEQQAKANHQDQQLQKRIGYLKDLRQAVLKNIDDELALEERAYDKYNKREIVIGQDPIGESLSHLSEARDWYNLFGDPKNNKVAERAGKRGDAMMQDERPKPFNWAWHYYDVVKLSEKIKKLTEQANRLGDAAAKKNEYRAAVDFYEIGHSETGENEDKINAMQARLAKESEKKEQATQKALKDITKDDKQQKEFKKGQDDLEKELGF